MNGKPTTLDRQLTAEIRRLRMKVKVDIAFIYIIKDDMSAGAYAFKEKRSKVLAQWILDQFHKACDE